MTVPTATWTIDTAHSEVAFTVRHLMSKVRGTFDEFSGEITTAGDDLNQGSVRAEVQMASVDTRNEQRDGHLRSSDVFNADANPTMTFVSTAITGADGEHEIAGDLTINGVTKPATFAAEFLGVDVDAGGVTRIGVEAKGQISKADFGVDFNIPLDGGKFLLGDKIDISLTIQATQA